jgi:hypothetical protein
VLYCLAYDIQPNGTMFMDKTLWCGDASFNTCLSEMVFVDLELLLKVSGQPVFLASPQVTREL